MIILDTNVISELFRSKEKATPVTSWLDLQDIARLWITAVSVMEIRFGIERLPESIRKARYADTWASVHDRLFEGRILAFDKDAAEIAGRLSAQRSRRGLIVGTNDTQIAGIAIAQKAAIATRNVRHFSDLPIDVIDPWTA